MAQPLVGREKGATVGQAELEKIKAMVGDYRQFKMKFIQFSKLCQQLARENNLPEISVGEIRGNATTWVVMDRSVMVRFVLVHAPDGTYRGRLDFDLPPGPHEDRPHTVFTLYFDRKGNMLESTSDAYSNRRIIDEHDVPYLLQRFLQKFLQHLI
jgi:hypothetical protein